MAHLDDLLFVFDDKFFERCRATKCSPQVGYFTTLRQTNLRFLCVLRCLYILVLRGV